MIYYGYVIAKCVHHTTSGEFGIVYKGHVIKEHGDSITDVVAIKTLKGT